MVLLFLRCGKEADVTDGIEVRQVHEDRADKRGRERAEERKRKKKLSKISSLCPCSSQVSSTVFYSLFFLVSSQSSSLVDIILELAIPATLLEIFELAHP